MALISPSLRRLLDLEQLVPQFMVNMLSNWTDAVL